MYKPEFLCTGQQALREAACSLHFGWLSGMWAILHAGVVAAVAADMMTWEEAIWEEAWTPTEAIRSATPVISGLRDAWGCLVFKSAVQLRSPRIISCPLSDKAEALSCLSYSTVQIRAIRMASRFLQ